MILEVGLTDSTPSRGLEVSNILLNEGRYQLNEVSMHISENNIRTSLTECRRKSLLMVDGVEVEATQGT